MVKGDPLKETELLVRIQDVLFDAPGVQSTARMLSHFGEHSLGWLALGAVGAVVDKRRRGNWVRLGAAALVSHAASVGLKRVVRRPRPHDERISVGVATPSKLSFPSSHATSTSAALVSLARITGSPLPLAGVPIMMLSRMVLGVHYPSDVATGAVVGAVTAETIWKLGREA